MKHFLLEGMGGEGDEWEKGKVTLCFWMCNHISSFFFSEVLLGACLFVFVSTTGLGSWKSVSL